MAELFIPDEPILGVTVILSAILILVLVLPFKVRIVEENLEVFFFIMGLGGVITIFYYGILPSTESLLNLFVKALKTPLAITHLGPVPIGIVQAVVFFGLIFYFFHRQIYSLLAAAMGRLGIPVFAFIFTFVLGLISSVISVIVTAVILAEIAAALNISRERKVKYVVYASFAVGIGAALTPLGEPLSTIAISKLNAHFTYLIDILGVYVVPGIAVSAAAAALSLRGEVYREGLVKFVYEETINDILLRGFRVFLFVAALELLGASFTPMVKWYFAQLPPWALYWINTISAVVDNATLTAAEIGPFLTEEQIRSALMSLLISGGMLIPGNIPNIVAAGRLRITMSEWARVGVPFGIVLLMAYFIVIEVLGIHITLSL
ncbi:predicted cation transporter [Aeropyrum camini SY1 = JCM 12091]|uniref:Predicted cation transporter n=1 Tax=Aeropyrum camini SY1 = JCM 12091 TaxID=1198449 RepID=U3TC09_9CREN|nr:DUF1646 family protein [Aeropyrum camini]BAN89575.1 predicted cation transporter [Aeropyrum camini SY1 = JCM 12091]